MGQTKRTWNDTLYSLMTRTLNKILHIYANCFVYHLSSSPSCPKICPVGPSSDNVAKETIDFAAISTE
jgi:hypothetical protein